MSDNEDQELRQLAEANFEKAALDLQWREVLGRVAHAALNEQTVQRLLARKPMPEREDAELALRQVAEVRQLFQRDATLPVRRFTSIEPLCANLERSSDGSAEQFRDAARVIEQALQLRRHSLQHRETCPELERLCFCDPELEGLLARILRTVDEHGEVLDSASEGLLSARRALARVNKQLRDTGSQLVGRYKELLSGQYLAERAGRFVLPVRADAPERVAGMILGSSGSGGTLYIEPRELSELNNRVYVAEAEALRECAKVLAELSVAAQRLSPALRRAEDNCLRADELSAIARWSLAADAHPLQFAGSGEYDAAAGAEQPCLHLYGMRHPLLLAAGDRDASEAKVVANDLHLTASQCLVVSGPNAGGKTVALKCLGLAVWLARSGLPVPCEPHSEIGWFEQVLTDIGDEQSISRSLSTFSAHVARLSEYLQLATRGTLVLLDEVAGGTDPDEGAALAAAILQRFVAQDAAVATTTHYERLKRLGAGESESFVNASVGFDWTRMAPTFSLSWGTPGRSSALAVAERYGISEAVVEHARTLLPKEQLHQQALLEKLETEHQLLSSSREQIEAELQEQRELTRRLQAEAEQAREKERRRLAEQASELTREVLEARALVRRAKAELKEVGQDAKAVRDVERILSQAAAPVTLQGNLTQAITEQRSREGSAAVSAADLSPGVKVHLPHLNAVGEVVSEVQKGAVRVNVGGMKLSVPVAQLRLLKGAPQAGQSTSKPRHAGLRRGHTQTRDLAPVTAFVPVRTTWNTCDLRGMRVEAGLETVSTFIDRMLQSNEPAAYILHGHGTGAMKEAVREHLSSSPHVARWEVASREDGGDALTVCWF